MPIESGVTRVADLNPQWPRDADIVREGASHLRLIKSALRSEGQSQIGFISMFYGTPAEVPAGWVICDGQNGTPDMRGRVPIGVSADYALGASGGAEEVTLTEAQIPGHTHAGSTAEGGSHNHTASSDSAGAHSHTGSAQSAGAHNHEIRASNWQTAGGSGGMGYYSSERRWGFTQTAGAHTHSLSINTGGAHEHAISVNSGGAHTHAVTVESTGGGEAHSIMQPYRALYFIMKVEG